MNGNTTNKSKWRYAPYIILYIISVTLVGTLDTVKGTFDFTRITEPDFWKVFVTLNAANWIGLLSTFSLRLAKILEEKERLFQEQKNVKIDLITDAYIRLKRALIYALNRLDAAIKLWLAKFNRERKIRAYKRKYQKKLTRLENRARYEDKAIYDILVKLKEDETAEYPEELKKYMKFKFWKIFVPWKWFSSWKRYFRKRRRLDQLLSDEYIDRNIDYMNVKFSRIGENFLRAGVIGGNQDEDNVPRSAFNKKFFDLLPRFLIGTSLTLFISSFFFEAVTPTWTMLVSVGMKLALLLWNIISGRAYAETFFKEHVVYHEQMRLNILTQFFSDTNKPAPTPTEIAKTEN